MDEIPPTLMSFKPEDEFLRRNLPRLALVTRPRAVLWAKHCTFCGLNGSSMAFRSKSPARILEEVTTLARRYRLLDFDIVDNILDFRYFRNVLPQLRELGYDLRLFYETKSNLQRDQVQLLRNAGVDRIQPGIESLSTPILTLMRKGVTAFQNVRLLKWCAEYGIHPSWNILYGLPGEPPDEYARMAQVVPSLTHFTPPVLGPIELSWFSPYYERPDEFGVEILGPSTWYRYVYDLDESTLTDLALIFEYRYSDGRVPDTYVSPLRREIEAWRDGRATSYQSARYRRGPGFLVIQDRRPNLERADYSFDDTEAQIYLACEDGATADGACATLRATGATDIDVADVEHFLDELVDLRLVYEEAGRYLALALPTNVAV
jgi:ribosomal peptide maturation radical SAM protein 1